MIEKGLDLSRPERTGVLFAVEDNELTDPVAIGRLGVGTEMASTADQRDLIQQTRGAGDFSP